MESTSVEKDQLDDIKLNMPARSCAYTSTTTDLPYPMSESGVIVIE